MAKDERRIEYLATDQYLGPMSSDEFYSFPVYDIIEFDHSQEYAIGDHRYIIFVPKENYGQSEEHLLSKILSSINLTLDDVMVFSLTKTEELTLSSIRSLGQRTYVLLFGVSPGRLGLNIEEAYFTFYKVDKWKILCAPGLIELATSRPAKKALWTALKQLIS